MDLQALLSRSEGKTLEFKRDLSSPEPILRAIVAFANTAGGTLLIGVEDGTKRVIGVPDPSAAEERVANLVSDLIAPRVVPDIEILPWRQTHLLAIVVPPAWGTAPHYLTKLGPTDGVYVRVGSSNRKADTTLIEDLKHARTNESFDEQPVVHASVDAIDFPAAAESFVRVRTLRREHLRTLRLTTLQGPHERPTVGGILLFGRDRLTHFPDAYIKMGRFAGTDRTKILDSAECTTMPIQAIDEVMLFLRKAVSREFIITGEARRQERWSVPETALREAVINAVVHADYRHIGMPIRVSVFSDRIQIENPGLLYRGLTIEDLLDGISKLRNRVIGRVFKELHLIEQWGSGVGRMVTACREAGLPDPIFEEVATLFRVTLGTTPRQAVTLDPRDEQIVQFLIESGSAASKDVGEYLGVSTRTARTRLAALVRRGIIADIGSSPTDPQRRYVPVAK